MSAYVFFSLLCTSCFYAAGWGGAPERIAAALFAVAAVLSALSGANSLGYRSIEWGVLVIDLALLVALLALALCANRYWPLWVTSLQFVTIWSHLAFTTLDTQMPWAYAVASQIWSFPILIILLLAVRRHQHRIRDFTVDRPWNGS
jgi:hypothetical protein